MEYFGNKYADYKPILPTKLIAVLSKVSTERQIPSKGLNIQQMSFALKEFGFGTRIYSKQQYELEFNSLIGSYVEGGIPIVLALENFGLDLDNEKVKSIGHAIICLGQEDITSPMIDALPAKNIENANLKSAFAANNITIYDYQEIERQFVFVDDNQPPYQKAFLSSPAIHYPDPDWHSCKVTSFIVPLYPKIYLEAFEAKNYALNFLAHAGNPLPKDSEVVIRAYITSNRSYKN